METPNKEEPWQRPVFPQTITEAAKRFKKASGEPQANQQSNSVAEWDQKVWEAAHEIVAKVLPATPKDVAHLKTIHDVIFTLGEPRAERTKDADGQMELRKTLRLAAKRLERCMCAGSDGRRLNLDVADKLKHAAKLETPIAPERKEATGQMEREEEKWTFDRDQPEGRRERRIYAWPRHIGNAICTSDARAFCDEHNRVTEHLRARYNEVHAIAVKKDRLWSEACNERNALYRRVDDIARALLEGLTRDGLIADHGDGKELLKELAALSDPFALQDAQEASERSGTTVYEKAEERLRLAAEIYLMEDHPEKQARLREALGIEEGTPLDVKEATASQTSSEHEPKRDSGSEFPKWMSEAAEEIVIDLEFGGELKFPPTEPIETRSIVIRNFARLIAKHAPALSGVSGHVEGESKPCIHNKKMIAEIREVILKHSNNETLANTVVEFIAAPSVGNTKRQDVQPVSEAATDFGEKEQ